MNGLSLAKRFYSSVVKGLIAEHLPDLVGHYAAGLIGYGSDVLGNDDELSRDHEWGPRLHLFISPELHQQHAKRMDDTLCRHLPATFDGFSTRYSIRHEMAVMTDDPAGIHHIVVTTPERFLQLTIGFQSVPHEELDWLLIPEQRLLELTRGEIFEDPVGTISELRSAFKYFPDPVWKYRLACLLMSTGWEYDLISLCGRRKDSLSMHISASATLERIMKICFVLNRAYCPFRKWLHREFAKLPLLSPDIGPYLEQARQQTDHASLRKSIDKALDAIMDRLRLESICTVFPADEWYFRGNAKYDLQRTATDILSRLPAGMSGLLASDLCLGGVDQWIQNEDALLAPELLLASRSLYSVRKGLRDQVGDAMI